MEIVLAIINAALLWAVWYFLGRGSIYAKRRALMLAMIGIHHRMNNKQKKREDD